MIEAYVIFLKQTHGFFDVVQLMHSHGSFFFFLKK